MLVQVMALLSFGVLCSSAPLQADGPTARRSLPRENVLVGLIIQEVLQDIEKLKLHEVPSVETVDATVERCMRSHLKTFASTLAALDKSSKSIARKLTRINTYKNILPEDLDAECKTVQVTREVFLETLDSFLRLLSEKVQSA